MYILVAVIALLGGGAGWYLKIYRPKRQGTAVGEEYEAFADDRENGFPGDWGEEQGDFDDTPPWDDGESGDGDEQ